MERRKEPNPSQDERVSLVRGICGGCVFALPVLYTMEMWWLAHTMPSWQVVLFWLVGYGLAVGLNYVSGFRADLDWSEVLQDALVALGLGALIAWVMLSALAVLTLDTSLPVVLKAVLILSVPISIGVSLARSVLGGHGSQGEPGEPAHEVSAWKADLADLGMTLVGGIFLGLSVAPTEEILTIASQARWWHVASIAALSVGLSYAMVFMAHITGQPRRLKSKGSIQSPWGETIVAYAVSLGVAYGLLWFLGYLKDGQSLAETLRMAFVLGLPVTLGGAAGRLVV